MRKGELTLVKSLNEFMEWASQFNQGGYLFRGVTNEGYDISASAYRRLKNTQDSDENSYQPLDAFLSEVFGIQDDVLNAIMQSIRGQ